MSKSRKLFTVLIAFLLAILIALSGCQQEKSEPKKETKKESGKVTVTDLQSRKVEVSTPAQKVVAIGPGALRLVCYVDGVDKVVGVENVEKQWPSTGRPYIMAYPELKNLPTIGQGGPGATPDAEKIATVKPDVIFVTYLPDKSQADELQEKTGVPVIVLSYGNDFIFGSDDDLYKSIELIGKVIGKEDRAKEVIDFFKECRNDLQERAKEVSESEKPSVYVGGLGMKGVHGIESSQAKYPPFVAIGARNVVDETGQGGPVMIDREQLLQWDPDIIFIDEGGYHLVLEDYKKNPDFYNSLSAVKNGKVYGQLPYNFYTTNVGTAIADAYWAGKVIFPEKFQDIDPAKKADEIYQFLLGKKLYEQMAKDYYGGYRKLDLSSD